MPRSCELTPQMLGMEVSLQTMPRIASMSFSCRASMLEGALESLLVLPCPAHHWSYCFSFNQKALSTVTRHKVKTTSFCARQ